MLARNSNKDNPAFQLQLQQTLDKQHCIQHHPTNWPKTNAQTIITFIIKGPTSPKTQNKNQCEETREPESIRVPSTPHCLMSQMQQWWRSATMLYKIARFFCIQTLPPPICSQNVTNYQNNSFQTQTIPFVYIRL